MLKTADTLTQCIYKHFPYRDPLFEVSFIHTRVRHFDRKQYCFLVFLVLLYGFRNDSLPLFGTSVLITAQKYIKIGWSDIWRLWAGRSELGIYFAFWKSDVFDCATRLSVGGMACDEHCRPSIVETPNRHMFTSIRVLLLGQCTPIKRFYDSVRDLIVWRIKNVHAHRLLFKQRSE